MTVDAKFFHQLGYPIVRKLPTGEWAGVTQFLFTWGLIVGLDEYGYRTRFCYVEYVDAMMALTDWDGNEDPPGPWIKEKGLGGDRTNPGLTNG